MPHSAALVCPHFTRSLWASAYNVSSEQYRPRRPRAPPRRLFAPSRCNAKQQHKIIHLLRNIKVQITDNRRYRTTLAMGVSWVGTPTPSPSNHQCPMSLLRQSFVPPQLQTPGAPSGSVCSCLRTPFDSPSYTQKESVCVCAPTEKKPRQCRGCPILIFMRTPSLLSFGNTRRETKNL